jgi:acetyltransferase-like isoleucine patch superfamily enzyme
MGKVPPTLIMNFGNLYYIIISKLKSISIRLKVLLYYQFIFGFFGKGSMIKKPLIINNPQNIFIGERVTILSFSWLSGPNKINEKFTGLIIGDNCAIGNFTHIYATESIIIEDNVLVADRVYISDNLHNFTNIIIPIIKQDIKQLSRVVIGHGSWIGENACIIGASIGKNSVIGANAVVTNDIPDYCVAVGIPARVIRKFNLENNKWESVNSTNI